MLTCLHWLFYPSEFLFVLGCSLLPHQGLYKLLLCLKSKVPDRDGSGTWTCLSLQLWSTLPINRRWGHYPILGRSDVHRQAGLVADDHRLLSLGVQPFPKLELILDNTAS
jgi:hypothetical protein